MRTAIRTYQSGGEIDTGQMLDERYFQTDPRVTPQVTPPPQASEVQPPPGAAGPTPTPVPPSAPVLAPPPPPPAPEPPPPPQGDQVVPYGQPRPGLGPRAISVDGQQQPPPQATTKVDDHDADLPKLTSSENEAWKIRRAPMGDQAILPSQPPEKYKTQDNPRYPDYQRAFAILNTKDLKTQAKLRPQLNKLWSEIQTETNAKNKQEHDAYIKDQTNRLHKLDADYLHVLQVPKLNDDINTGLSTQAKTFDDVIANGKVEDAQAAMLKRKASPLDTMTNSEQLYVVRNIMALNKKLDANQAAQVLVLIGSPVLPGQKSFNGLAGKGGTKYKADSSDLIGNRQIQVPGFGLIRIEPEFLNTVNKRRMEGYANALKFEADLKKQREEAKQPNRFDRAVAPVMDWISKQVQ